MSRGPELGVDRDLDRVGAVVGGDAGADAAGGLDRDREGGLQRRLVLRRHQVEAELLAAFGGERQADQATRFLGHEVDRLGRRELRRHHQVALVLAVLAVADDDHPAAPDLFERFLDRREGGLLLGLGHLTQARSFPANGATRRSTYFATMSHSTLTLSPGRARPRLVRSRVSGIRETSKPRIAQIRDRQADPAERDRALVDGVAQQLRRPGSTRIRRAKPSSSIAATVPTPSTWPWTMWPPSRSEARIASSRLTRALLADRAERGDRQASGSSPRSRRRGRRCRSRSGRRR